MAAEPTEHQITVHLEQMLAERGMTLTELAARADITLANLSILKNGRARAIRFSTLTTLCQILDCQPGDLLRHAPTRPDGADGGTSGARDAPGGRGTRRVADTTSE